MPRTKVVATVEGLPAGAPDREVILAGKELFGFHSVTVAEIGGVNVSVVET